MNKNKRMSIFGIGHKVGIPTVIYLGAAYYFTNKYPEIFRFPSWDLLQSVRVPKGLFLLGIGLAVLLISAGQLVYAYSKKRLAKSGFYRLVANPLYANAVVFIIPGLSLFLDSWLMLTGSIVLYLLYHHFISEEYQNLKALYGKEYEDYYNSILLKWL